MFKGELPVYLLMGFGGVVVCVIVGAVFNPVVLWVSLGAIAGGIVWRYLVVKGRGGNEGGLTSVQVAVIVGLLLGLGVFVSCVCVINGIW
jgi:4-hydroxybenzoate polyprenyltransferase